MRFIGRRDRHIVKMIKYLFWALGGLAIVMLIVVAAFALLFDPNAWRDDITRLVEKQTGRELVIEGDLSLSFYPWLGFTAGRTTLSNAAGFEEPVMASFDRASASVRLIPLLSKRIELSRITLDNLDLTLQRKADGTSNWDDLIDTATAEAEDDEAGSNFATEGIGGVALTDANIVYDDAQSGVRYEARDLQLETGAIRPGEAVALEGAGYLVSGDPAVEGPATVAASVELGDDGVLRLASPVFTIDARGESVPGERMELALKGEALTLDGDVLTLTVPALELDGTADGDPWNRLAATVTGANLVWTAFDAFAIDTPKLVARMQAPATPDGLEATVAGKRLTGSVEAQTAEMTDVSATSLGVDITSPEVSATQIFDALTLAGPLRTAPFNPRKVLAALDNPDIVTADPQALSSMQLAANARYGPDAISLRDIDAKLDDSAIAGSLTYRADGGLRFDLRVDTVNIDRYREPSQESDDQAAAAGLEEIEIPVETLRELDLEGTLRVRSMQLVGLKSTGVTIGIKTGGGDVRVNPATASLYGGSYNGDIRLDVRGATPVLSLNERLSGIQFGPFSKDLMDADRLSGTLDGSVQATGRGPTAAAITASANGEAAFKFTDGAYEGTDLWYRVRRARAVIERDTPPAKPEQERTRFANLSGTAKIVDGVMTTDDISMVLPFMQVRGRGNVELLSQTLDLRLVGDLVDRPDLSAGVNDLVGIAIPFKVTGAVASPDVNVDMGAVLAELAKRKLGEKLGLSKEQAEAAESTDAVVEQKKEELKDKVDAKAKEVLRGLLGGGDG